MIFKVNFKSDDKDFEEFIYEEIAENMINYVRELNRNYEIDIKCVWKWENDY
jgi:hypothetical protein